MEFVRRVYENSKVTIPKEIRDLHGIQTGDYVKFVIVEVLAAPARATPPTKPTTTTEESP